MLKYKQLLINYFSLFAFILFPSFEVFSQDTTIVQTLTFDSIATRRAIWDFPDNNDTYRKILMFYTLKCDPRTPWDKYNCGEWDYLTYNIIHKHTGNFDSIRTSHPHYMVGSEAPPTIKITNIPTHSIYQRKKYGITQDSIKSESEYKVINGNKELSFPANSAHFQYMITKKILKDNGLTKGLINKLKLNIKEAGSTLRNFTIKIKHASSTMLTEFDRQDFTIVYSQDVKFSNTGWNDILFINTFDWNGFFNILIDISYESDESGKPNVLMAGDSALGLQITETNKYFEFDGKNDYIDCGYINKLNGIQKCTYEAWVKINQWKPWSFLMGKGDKFHIEFGGSSGDIYCINRPYYNTYGYAKNVLNLNQWSHIAMVYDGTQKNNSDKLKLYVDGVLRSLQFSGDIPSSSPPNDEPFAISQIFNANAPIDGSIDEVRVWTEALEGQTLADWRLKPIVPSHPNYKNLLIYYPFEEGSNTEAMDKSGNNLKGTMIGVPAWKDNKSDESYFNPEPVSMIPNMIFCRGDYSSHIDSSIVADTINNPPVSIAEYEIKDHKPVVKKVFYAWLSGYQYSFGPDGNKIDSVFISPQRKLLNLTLSYYQEPYPITDDYEIGRFITPYGINLDLGPDGFTWVYDVTDYASLLKGKVDFEAGNTQELIDVKFLFIKGTTPRNVLKITKLWNKLESLRGISYADLSNDKELFAITVPLHPDAKQFKVKTRLSGHGHNSNDGNYPHCCEWKDNTHYLYVNGKQEFDWHIFQYDDCALNPVYPQGGTWPGSREGWCPGDLVKDHEFEITPFVKGDSVTLDYDITKVPADNQGMGGGNYVVSMQLIQYSAPNYNLDAEISDVITPNDFRLYSRLNPICANPIVQIRNNGSEPLTSLKFEYSVDGGTSETYNWTGQIPAWGKDNISLPVSSGLFWIGNGKNNFNVKTSLPNGKQDEYRENDTYSTHFNMPDLYKKQIVIWYKTNLRPADYIYEIKDLTGNVAFSKSGLSNNTLYKDTLNLPDGCYSLNFTDPANLGLSYWAYADQGNGYLQVRDLSGNLLKTFDPDFGHGIFYSFDLSLVTLVQERNDEYLLSIFPNPAEDKLNIIFNYEFGESEVKIFDEAGKMVLKDKIFVNDNFEKVIDTKNFASGAYIIRIVNGKFDITKKFIKK
jgi:hypothetical protein